MTARRPKRPVSSAQSKSSKARRRGVAKSTKRPKRAGKRIPRLASVAPTPERRALDAVAWMRRGKSLTKAAKLAHTKPDTVRRHAREALARLDDGRYTPVFDDRLPRPLWFLTDTGRIPVTVRSSRDASLIGQHASAVNIYLRTGKSAPLRGFEGKTIRIGRRRVGFLTDLRTIRTLAHAGEVQFHDLYASLT